MSFTWVGDDESESTTSALTLLFSNFMEMQYKITAEPFASVQRAIFILLHHT